MLEHVQIHDTGIGRLHEEEGNMFVTAQRLTCFAPSAKKECTAHSFFAEGVKHVHLWAVTNIFQGGTWIFAVPDPDPALT
jgi:hypothetical protein